MIYKRALDSRTRTTTRLSHRTTASACKPASSWRENFDTVVISVRGFAKMLACNAPINVKPQGGGVVYRREIDPTSVSLGGDFDIRVLPWGWEFDIATTCFGQEAV